MRARFTFFAMLMFLLFAAILVTAQSGADPVPRCVQIGRGPAGPLAEIQCREDALRNTTATNPHASMLFWLAEAYNRLENEAKAEEYYRKLTAAADHCAAAPDLCREAKKRLEVLRSDRLLEVTTPFTFDAYSFAISPDGKRIVYLATVEGKTALWLRHLDSGKSAVIPGTDRVRYNNSPNGPNPFWSSDGKSIAFFADNKLQRIDEGGGDVKVLADAPENFGGSWAGDVILYVPTNRSAVYSVPASGGATKPVTRLPNAGVSHRYPQFLDGVHFLFLPTGGESLAIGSLDRPEVKALGISTPVARFAPPDQLLFLSNDMLYAQRLDPITLELNGNQVRLAASVATSNLSGPGYGAISVAAASGTIVFRANAGARTQLVWFDRQGRRIGTVGQPGLSMGPPRISLDGRTVALYNNPGTVQLLDLESRDGAFRAFQLTTGAQGNALLNQLLALESQDGAFRSFPLTTGTQGNAWNETPVWAPDGRSLAFAFPRAGGPVFDVHRLQFIVTQGSRTEVLVKSDETTIPLDWSKDGVLLFVKTSASAQSLFARSANGRAEILIAENTSWGRFSPDGNWIAYQTGGHVYIQPFPGSAAERVQVSDKEGHSPEWSRKGSELYFLSPDNHLMVAGISLPDAAEPVKVADAKVLFADPLPEGSTYAPAPDGQGFLVLDSVPPAPILVLSHWTRSKGVAPAPPLTLSGGDALGVNASVTTAPRGASGAGATQPWQIAVYDRQGKLQRRLGELFPSEESGRLSISPDGTRIATIQTGSQIMSVIDIASNTTTRVATKARTVPTWSPDGRRLAFLSTGEKEGLYIKASNGEGPEQLLGPPGFYGGIWNWSLDGQFIGLNNPGSQIVVKVDDGKVVPVVPGAAIGSIRLSPDSRFVAYLSNEFEGVNQVFVRKFDPEDPDAGYYRKITSSGTAGGNRWRFDGKELYHLASDGGVMAIPIETTPRIQEGTAVELFHVPPGFPVLSGLSGMIFDVSADGQLFAFLLPVDPEPPRQLEKSRPKRTPSITSYRDLVGESLTIPLVGSTSGRVSGDGVYTDNSQPAAAAVHAGILGASEFGWVRIVVLPGQSSYPGTMRNGVTSEASGPGEGSFRIERAPPPYVVQLPHGEDASRLVNVQMLRGRLDASFVIQVVGAAQGPLWGSDVYTDDSPIGVAAVHAGLLKDNEVGFVRVIPMPGRERYTASANNGVRSASYGPFAGSYRLEGVER